MVSKRASLRSLAEQPVVSTINVIIQSTTNTISTIFQADAQ
jgi:hypothetical protein